MISKAALSVALLAAIAAGVMAWLWQGERGEAALLRHRNASLEKSAAATRRANVVAAKRAAEIEAELETYRAALAALANEDIPDEALDPSIIAILCSVQPPGQRTCTLRNPAGTSAPGARSGAGGSDDE